MTMTFRFDESAAPKDAGSESAGNGTMTPSSAPSDAAPETRTETFMRLAEAAGKSKEWCLRQLDKANVQTAEEFSEAQWAKVVESLAKAAA